MFGKKVDKEEFEMSLYLFDVLFILSRTQIGTSQTRATQPTLSVK